MMAGDPRLVKADGLDTDELNGELVLAKLHPQSIVMLNAAGLAMWRGLDAVNTRSELIEVVKEALPTMGAAEIERSVGKLIDDLIAGGFLIEKVGEPE
jgi:hypothetical protein